MTPLELRRAIIADVCAAWGVTEADLIGPSLARRFSHPRQEAMWRLRQLRRNGEPLYSYPQLGQIFGGRDHTTAMWGVKAHAKRLAAFPQRLAA